MKNSKVNCDEQKIDKKSIFNFKNENKKFVLNQHELSCIKGGDGGNDDKIDQHWP